MFGVFVIKISEDFFLYNFLLTLKYNVAFSQTWLKTFQNTSKQSCIQFFCYFGKHIRDNYSEFSHCGQALFHLTSVLRIRNLKPFLKVLIS